MERFKEFIDGLEAIAEEHIVLPKDLTEDDEVYLFMATQMYQLDPQFRKYMRGCVKLFSEAFAAGDLLKLFTTMLEVSKLWEKSRS